MTMGDVTLTLEAVILYDNWPGVAVPPPFPVTDMESSLVGHGAASPMWDVGTKWELYCYGNQVSVGVSYLQGFTTFIYGKAAPDIDANIIGARTVTVVPDETIAAGDADNLLYALSSDDQATTHENSGLTAVCLSTLTNDYYYWFWCGGVCPVEYVSALVVADTLDTDDSVDVASCELSTVVLADTGIGYKMQATNSQTPGVGIALFTD